MCPAAGPVEADTPDANVAQMTNRVATRVTRDMVDLQPVMWRG